MWCFMLKVLKIYLFVPIFNTPPPPCCVVVYRYCTAPIKLVDWCIECRHILFVINEALNLFKRNLENKDVLRITSKFIRKY